MTTRPHAALPIPDALEDQGQTHKLLRNVERDSEDGEPDEDEQGQNPWAGELLLGDEKGEFGEDGLGHPEQRPGGEEKEEKGDPRADRRVRRRQGARSRVGVDLG